MNDRELLEMAAKAAGYTLEDDSDVNGEWWPWCVELKDHWHPLVDDGDALRLATKLNLLIDTCGMCARPLDDSIGWVDGVGDTAEGRVRFAIVKVAAEIGRGMK